GLAACAVWPRLPVLGGVEEGRVAALLQGGIGWAAGFFGLWAVALLGEAAFGKKAMRFEKAVEWEVREAEDDDVPMRFVIDGEETTWWALFFRKTDRLVVECETIRLDGVPVGGGTLTIRELEITLPDGTT